MMTASYDLAGTRCGDCLHWFPCDFEDRREAERDLGDVACELLASEYGMCEIDSPAIVSRDHRAFDRDGYECWEAR